MTEKIKRITGPMLKALAEFYEQHPKPLAGSDLINARGLLSGTLYPMLDRLEGAGWLESEDEDVDPSVVGRPQRILYTLTNTGLQRARAELMAVGVPCRPLPSHALIRGGGVG